MAISINSIQNFQLYLNGVIDRANHHAGPVEGVSLALLGAVMWKANGVIEVKEFAGRPANILWFEVNSNRYALTYNHQTQRMELRERKLNGNVLDQFDNSTT